MPDGPGPAPWRVMVAAAHPMWRAAVERDLVAAGFDVVAVAADGNQAIARFALQHVDLDHAGGPGQLRGPSAHELAIVDQLPQLRWGLDQCLLDRRHGQALLAVPA